MANSLPSTLFPILVFALEHEGLRIPITQFSKALNLENLVFDNFDPKKSIKYEIIAVLKYIERYFTHIAKFKNTKIGDFQNQIANLQAQLFTLIKKNAKYAERFLDAYATPSVGINRRTTKNLNFFDTSEKNTVK
jgi:hypothetical protein